MSEKLKVENHEENSTRIRIVDHPEFEGDMKTNIITSIQMAEIVSSLFAPAMPDYYGCKICVNDGHLVGALANEIPIGGLYVDLYFKDMGGDSEKKNIIVRGSNVNGKDLVSRFMNVNGTNNSRAYEVTKRTYEMLEEFMPNGNRTRWAAFTSETTSSMGIYGKEEVVVCISGLSLNKIIDKIYGTKSEEGRYEYAVARHSYLPYRPNEFLMSIMQLDVSVIRELNAAMGNNNPSTPQFHQYRK